MRDKWFLGVISGASLLAVGYIVLQTLLYQVEALYWPVGTLTIAMIFGLALKLMVYGKPKGVYTILSSTLLWNTLLLVFAGTLIIIVSMSLLTATLSAVDTLLLAGMAAVCESWAIAGVQDVADYYTDLAPVGIVFGALFACFLHFMVYGSVWLVLGGVFVGFLVLNTAYYLSGGRVEVPILIHLIYNLYPFILAFLFGV